MASCNEQETFLRCRPSEVVLWVFCGYSGLSAQGRWKKITSLTFNQLPLSSNSARRMVDVLAEDCFSAILANLKEADYMSLAIDKSCDVLACQGVSFKADRFGCAMAIDWPIVSKGI